MDMKKRRGVDDDGFALPDGEAEKFGEEENEFYDDDDLEDDDEESDDEESDDEDGDVELGDEYDEEEYNEDEDLDLDEAGEE